MGLLGFLKRLLFAEPPPALQQPATAVVDAPARAETPPNEPSVGHPVTDALPAGGRRSESCARKPRLAPLRYDAVRANAEWVTPPVIGPEPPYRFAHFALESDSYYDLSRDVDPERLHSRRLPVLATPEELAQFLEIPLGKLAWLIHRFHATGRPGDVREAHYHYRWIEKRSGGLRLIEAPKSMLKDVQIRILREILDRVPAHPAAHGFVRARSVRTNAQPHVGRDIIVKLDLQDFYGSIHFNRVVAIFRSLGYSREVALWLARLTTSVLPLNINVPVPGESGSLVKYQKRHLPQGAPTSPALANLAAFPLDLRLHGFARSFSATYTRYADDLTFSGGEHLNRGLSVFLPLVRQIICSERFHVNKRKFQILRKHQRQAVTGVVVNRHANVSRRDFDRLKAVLTNCVRYGPRSQNRENRPDFAAHLRGRIAHVAHLNPARGAKLLALFSQIDWSESE